MAVNPLDISILVVGPDSVYQNTLLQMLGNLGFKQVDEAPDGAKAWEIIKRTNPQIVIAQWDMPEITGLALLRLIRADADFSDMPVLLSTREITRSDVVRAGEAGVNAILVEPVSIDNLESKLRIILEFEMSPTTKKAKEYMTKGELYLTDIVKMADSVVSAQALDPHEGDGINSRDQLAAAAAAMQHRINTAHMRAGVTLIDPRSTYIGPLVTIARDVEIWPGVHIMGKSDIKGRVRIMPGTWIKDATIGAQSTIGQHCHIEGATVSPGAVVAPQTILAI